MVGRPIWVAGTLRTQTCRQRYLTKHNLKQSKQHRKNFKRRVLFPLRDAWVATQSIQPQVGQSILESQAVAQRCSTHDHLNLSSLLLRVQVP